MVVKGHAQEETGGERRMDGKLRSLDSPGVLNRAYLTRYSWQTRRYMGECLA